MKNEIDLLRNFYGQGIHLYSEGVFYDGWFLVPVDWGNSCYTISCFCPKGSCYIDWRDYNCREDAIAAGREFAEQIILKMASQKIPFD